MINNLPPASGERSVEYATHKKTKTHTALDASNWQAALSLVSGAQSHAEHVSGTHKAALKSSHGKSAPTKVDAGVSRGKVDSGQSKVIAKAAGAKARMHADAMLTAKAEHATAKTAAGATDSAVRKAQAQGKNSPAEDAKASTDKTAQGPGRDASAALHRAQKQPLAQTHFSVKQPSISKTSPANGPKAKTPQTIKAMQHTSSLVSGHEASPVVGASPANQSASSAEGQFDDRAAAKSFSRIARVQNGKKSTPRAGSGSLTDGASLSAAKPGGDSASQGSSAFAGALSQIQATPGGAHNAAPLAAKSLQIMAAQMQVLHQAGGGQASIRLDPPALGRVQIQLQMQQQNQAQVSFSAAQQTTAQALQASLPQLTNAMHQAGVHLVHSEVNVAADAGSSGQGAQHGAQGQPGQSGQSHHHAGRWSGRGAMTPDRSSNDAMPAGANEKGVRAYA